MSSPTRTTCITAIRPLWVIKGGRITIEGSGFPIDGPRLPDVRIGGERARVVYASPSAISVVVPELVGGGRTTVRIEGVPGETAFVEVATTLATGLHQVDNPVFDREGNLYVTFSGTRGQEVPVSIFCVRPNGTRETFSSGIVNPTSMAIDPEGRLYVSSRFEGTVYRVTPDGSAAPFASDLGVACGLAFAPDGTLYVGDRSGTIFRVDREGRAEAFAAVPPSVHPPVAGSQMYESYETRTSSLSSPDPPFTNTLPSAMTVAFAHSLPPGTESAGVTTGCSPVMSTISTA